MLEGALAAEGKVSLAMNVCRYDLEAVLASLPALYRPTLTALSDPEWVDVSAIVEEDAVHRLVPRLKQAGASGIVEYPLNKLIE